MTRRWDVVTVGEIYIDHVFSGLTHWPTPGEEVFTRDYTRDLGGGTAITACSLARLGWRTAIFGMIGAEEENWIRRRLGDYGVHSEYLRTPPPLSGLTTGVTISVSFASERSFYSYAGANLLLAEYLESPNVMAQLRLAAHVHFAVPLERSVALRLLPELKSAGISISMDVGWQPTWLSNAESLATCRTVDYFLPNQREAHLLTGLATGSEDVRQVMQGLAEIGLDHAILKLGPRGAIAIEHGRILEVSSPGVRVVDTTGAGDAFDAGLIDGILHGETKRKMMQRAAACGSLSTRNAGALNGLPTREELEAVNV